jgi:hypothetical protein
MTMSNERKTVEVTIPASLLRQAGPAMIVEGEHALRVIVPVAGQGLGTACTWEDCDQEPIYCQGHALELCGVSSPDEARIVRMRLEEVVKAAQEYFATAKDEQRDQLARVEALAFFLRAIDAGDQTLRRWPK